MFFIQPAVMEGDAGDVPAVNSSLLLEAAQVILRGDPLTITSGALVKHALVAVVTNIAGFALEPTDKTRAGADIAGESAGPANELSYAKATARTNFISQMVDSGAIKTDLSAVAVGDQYGLLVHSDGYVYADFDDTTNVVIEITKVINENVGGQNPQAYVQWKVIASAIQQP